MFVSISGKSETLISFANDKLVVFATSGWSCMLFRKQRLCKLKLSMHQIGKLCL